MRLLRFIVGGLLGLLISAGPAGAQMTLDQLRGAAGGTPSTPTIVNQPSAIVVPEAVPADLSRASRPSALGPENQLGPRPSAPGPESLESGVAHSSPGEKTEFQLFVQKSIGRELPLFGHNLFTNVPSTFAPLEQVPVPADYVVGPGDEIVVRAWGQIDIDYRATVDRNGKIYIPKIGEIGVAGLKAEKLDSYIRASVARLYKNFHLDVALGQLRSIQIFVVGQARRPGSYVIGSLSTLVNALFASGGPSYKGSMRRIQLKRGGNVVTEFDLYDLLLRGDMSKDVKLLPGDVIFIPPVGPLAAVSGSVHVPAIYELKPRTTLGDVIDMAGGLATTASTQKVTLERIMNRETRFVEEYDLNRDGLGRELRDGDIATVYTLSPRIANAVTLRGNVAETMRFPWHEGMKISDIIPEKDALIVPDYWLKKNRAGRAESWLRGGAGSDSPNAGQLRRELVRASVEVNWEYAVIERLNLAALEPTLIPFNLGKAVLDKDPGQNLLLLPGDVITIFSADDIRVPKARRSQFVRLEGEFNAPGVYQIQPGETLRELIMRVGGLTDNAYLYGAQFTREETRKAQQEQLEALVNRLEAEAERAALQRSQAVVSKEEADSLAAQTAAQKRLIAQYRQIKAIGRIVLNLPMDGAKVKDLPPLPLEDGDAIVVPPLPGTVNVFGAVYNQNSYLYVRNDRAGDYLDKAGGPTRDADKASIYLVRADGSVVSEQQKGWFGSVRGERMNPGDSVLVPETFDKFNLTKELKDWSQIFYQFALGAAAIKVIKDL